MSNDVSYSELSINGLWKNNPALVQLLGLCPLLAVSGSVVNALGLGLATIFVLVCSNSAVSLIRNIVSDAIRLPAFVMIIASFTTCIKLLMQAYAYDLYQILGIFIPLIVTNCSILGRADAFACKNRLLPSMYDGFIMGVGFTLVLVLLGTMRELVGTGAVFADMNLLFGDGASAWKITVFNDYPGFILAIVPPGAFIFTGLLIALKNVVDKRIKERAEARKEKPVLGNKRVRVTGTIK